MNDEFNKKTMLKLDKKTLDEYKNAWINKLFVDFYNAWCSGTKIKLEENIPENAVKVPSEDIEFYALEENVSHLSDAKISNAGHKFYLHSKDIKEKCGCGSSFSFESKAIDMAKIKNLKHTFKWITPQMTIIKTSTNKEITVENKDVIVIDDSENNVNITLKNNANAKIFGLISGWEKNVQINQDKTSKTKVNYIISPKSEEVKSQIQTDLNWDEAETEVNIVTLSNSSLLASVDGIINIPKWVKKVKWHLKQENLMLDEKSKIRWIPRLMVASNDIEASHAMKVEKIDENRLFYLTSRWIDKKTAENMVKESYINKILDGLPKAIFEKLKDEALK